MLLVIVTMTQATRNKPDQQPDYSNRDEDIFINIFFVVVTVIIPFVGFTRKRKKIIKSSIINQDLSLNIFQPPYVVYWKIAGKYRHRGTAYFITFSVQKSSGREVQWTLYFDSSLGG